MNQFINTKNTLVTEAIDGFLRGGEGRLARLDGYPHIKVVVRTDWDRSKVALVSGGGSGHEPAHAGFVGQGMLTAAVCGEVFASPSVDAVLAGILAVTGEAGCLLIVKNYTGDRLNFGLAAERARSLGLKVAMVVVDDDVALPDLPQARGVAGTLFVHKIAGALAEGGADLDTVAAAARRVIDGVVSIGMSLDTCTVPGSPKEVRIEPGKAELGLGIHGEAGVEQVDFEGAREAVAMVVDRLAANLGPGPHAVLLNNLGGAMPLEMSVLAEELARSEIADRLKWMVGPADMMTSLDMHGFSVSLLPVSADDEAALQAPAAPWAWPGLKPVGGVEVLPLPEGLAPIRFVPSADPGRRALVGACCEILIGAEAELNALDAKSGDGDTGNHARDRLPLADRGARPAASGRSDPALSRRRNRAQPDHGRVVRRAAGHLLRRGGGRLGQWRGRHRCAGRRVGPHTAGGRRRTRRPYHDRRAGAGAGGAAGRVGTGDEGGACRRRPHRDHPARQGRAGVLCLRRSAGRQQRSRSGGRRPAIRAVAAEIGQVAMAHDSRRHCEEPQATRQSTACG